MLILEYGHKYMDDELNEDDLKIKEKVNKIINILIEDKEKIKYVSLLDDLHIEKKNFTVEEYINNYKIDNNILNVFMESDMIKYAKDEFKIIENKCKKEYFRKENKYVYFYESENGEKFALKEEKDNIEKFYCVFLSYVWNIFKRSLGCSTLLTIIDLEFKPIEEKVIRLLKENKKEFIKNNYYIYI